MKINRIITYILICLLTSQITTLLVPVKGDVEGAEGSVTVPTADGSSNQPVDPATQLKLFKDDSNNDKVPIEAKDFFQDRYRGHLTYVLKKGVMCTLVKFGNKDVWKKGVENVQEPKSVTYDPFMMELAVRDAKYSVHFGMDSQTSDWKHVVTYERGKRFVATKREMTLTFMRPSRSRSSSPKPQFVTSDSSWSMSVTKTASTTLPKQAKAQQEPVKSPEKEADQTSTVPLGTTEDQPESGSGSALRGTSVTAGASGESEDPAKVSSGEGDTTNESGQESTKEGNETEDGGEKEASAEADGSTGSASAETDWTAGEGADGSASSPADGASATHTGAGDGTGTSGESEDASSRPSGGAPTSGPDADGTSGSPPAVPAVPSGGSASGQGARTAGSDADDTSQPSGGAPTSGGTETSGLDGSPSGSPEAGGTSGESGEDKSGDGGSTEGDGSSATPPASSGGDDTSSTPGQGLTTPTGSPAEASESGTKTAVELSIKKTSGTNEFNYEKADKVVTYTAKSGYGFSSVKTKTGGSNCGSSCCGSDLTIWDAKEASEYSTMVVVDGKGKKQKEVTIHQPNNSKKVFKRDDKSKPWTEVSQQSNQSNDQQCSGTPASGTSPAGGAAQGGAGSTLTSGGGTDQSGDGSGGTGTGGQDGNDSDAENEEGTGTGCNE